MGKVVEVFSGESAIINLDGIVKAATCDKLLARTNRDVLDLLLLGER